MLIYISHPYGGRAENKAKIEQIIHGLAAKDKANTYVSPVHCFGFMYNSVPYLHGLGMCLDLLGRCDKMIVFGDWQHSIGCREEIRYCQEHGIAYVVCHEPG